MVKRNFALTHDQIAIIQQALGIAEKQFTKTREIVAELTYVRHNESFRYDQTKIGDYYHVKSCEFAELNDAIQNGELDV